MANLGLELLILTVLLIYFGIFMTQNFYQQSMRANLRKNIYCVNSQSNHYCITE